MIPASSETNPSLVGVGGRSGVEAALAAFDSPVEQRPLLGAEPHAAEHFADLWRAESAGLPRRARQFQTQIQRRRLRGRLHGDKHDRLRLSERFAGVSVRLDHEFSGSSSPAVVCRGRAWSSTASPVERHARPVQWRGAGADQHGHRAGRFRGSVRTLVLTWRRPTGAPTSPTGISTRFVAGRNSAWRHGGGFTPSTSQLQRQGGGGSDKEARPDEHIYLLPQLRGKRRWRPLLGESKSSLHDGFGGEPMGG